MPRVAPIVASLWQPSRPLLPPMVQSLTAQPPGKQQQRPLQKGVIVRWLHHCNRMATLLRRSRLLGQATAQMGPRSRRVMRGAEMGMESARWQREEEAGKAEGESTGAAASEEAPKRSVITSF